MTQPEFAAEINRIQVALMNLAIEVGALAERMPVPPVLPKRPRAAKRGQNTKLVLDMLRTAPEPMTVRAVAMGLMVALGMDAGDRKEVKAMIALTRTALLRQQKRGVLRSRMVGDVALWEVAKVS